MTQLIFTIFLLYAVVGSVGFWAVRRQREIRSQTVPDTVGSPTRNRNR